MAKLYVGNHGSLKLSEICLTGEKKTEKTHLGNLSQPGIEPEPAARQTRMLTACPTAVDKKCCVCLRPHCRSKNFHGYRNRFEVIYTYSICAYNMNNINIMDDITLTIRTKA